VVRTLPFHGRKGGEEKNSCIFEFYNIYIRKVKEKCNFKIAFFKINECNFKIGDKIKGK
jgi:hypothetical protein